MALWMYQVMHVVGQMSPSAPWEEPEPAKPAAPVDHRLNFGDLQKSFRAELNGESNDGSYRNMLLIIVCLVVVLGIALHFWQRHKNGGPPNSMRSLGRELSRAVHFPLGSRIMLWWVAHTTKVPVAVLLISGDIYEASVQQWSRQPTFGLVREWGAGRLKQLQAVLFEA